MPDDEIEPVPRIRYIGEPATGQSVPQTGKWLITSESGSRYFLDLDMELLTRIRGSEDLADPEIAYPSKLRDHGRSVRLLRFVGPLEVGRRTVFDIESLGGPDVAFTRRTTTRIVEIIQLPDDTPPIRIALESLSALLGHELLSQLVGKGQAAIDEWMQGTRIPTSEEAERVDGAHAVVAAYGPHVSTDELRDWFLRPSKTLGGRRPVDAVASNRTREAIDAGSVDLG